MNKRATPLLLTLLLLTLLLAACGQSTTPATSSDDSMAGMDHGEMGMEDDMAASLESMEGAEFEIAFLDAMIPHHQSAIEMAEIALERSARPEIQGAAQAIIAAQQAEIAQMTGWLQEWHGVAPSGEDHGMSMMAEVEALRTVPAEEFDVAFLEAMIPHHDGAIEMAELVAGRTDRPELLAVAEAILSAQRTENEQFERWIAEWGGSN